MRNHFDLIDGEVRLTTQIKVVHRRPTLCDAAGYDLADVPGPHARQCTKFERIYYISMREECRHEPE